MITNDSEFLQYAMSKYDNPHLASLDDFEQDIKRFTYINNLLNRYRLDKTDLKDRLILNHLVILGNIFTIPGSLRLLEYKIHEQNKEIIKTFFVYLGVFDKNETTDQYLLDVLNAT